MEALTPYKARALAHRAQDFLYRASGMAETLFHARQAGRLGKVLVTARLISEVLDVLVPEMSTRDILKSKGYTPFPGELGRFCLDTLRGSAQPQQREVVDDEITLIFTGAAAWAENKETTDSKREPRKRASYHQDEDLWVKAGQEEAVLEAVQREVWKDEAELQMTVRRPGFFASLEKGTRGEWRLTPMPATGKYIARPPVSYYAERLQTYKGGRTLLLIGPSGVGKTVLVRLLSASMKHGRLLKITSAAVRKMEAGDLIELVEALRPETLLLDDLPLTDGPQSDTTGDWLALLEALHGKCPLIALTFMEEPGTVYRRNQGGDKGGNCFSGMRPGRVDETIRLGVPDKTIRKAILEAYADGEDFGFKEKDWDELLDKTRGLTGAYLRELVDRLHHHGKKRWKSEVESLLLQSPHLNRPRGARRGRLTVAKTRRQGAKSAADCVLRLIKENQDNPAVLLSEDSLQSLLAASYSSYGHKKSGQAKTKALLLKMEAAGTIQRKATKSGEAEIDVFFVEEK